MKLRSAPLDDLLNECDYVLRDDGRRVAMLVLRTLGAVYAALRGSMLVVLRLRYWQSGALERQVAHPFPAAGDEPFNLSPDELKSAWREQ